MKKLKNIVRIGVFVFGIAIFLELFGVIALSGYTELFVSSTVLLVLFVSFDRTSKNRRIVPIIQLICCICFVVGIITAVVPIGDSPRIFSHIVTGIITLLMLTFSIVITVVTEDKKKQEQKKDET